MAYILGFFAADGYITINKRGGNYWSINIADRDLLKKIKKEIKSEHKIGTRVRKNKGHITYRLQVGSKKICADIRKIGFHENKTMNMNIPKVPLKYFCHFTRGYFDGDGNVWVGLIHKERKTRTLAIQTVFTSCSESFLLSLRNKLEFFGINKGVIRKGKGNYFRLTYSINNSLKLSNFMYNDLDASRLYLSRKRDVFRGYIKMRP